ncbi:beta-xylosidase [Bombiscardovia nodaiensis]|uniref:Beta-xylosidase n=1 Tax=Bombiscardovia nodaiensis TaxID=2932181 RepID=A0ABM8B675_9BIFI|nr:beta-xylosidase [Bombiscardovia nodaiensis]
MEEHAAAEDGKAYIHDPAIAKEGGRYYIFGTHRRFASSPDLLHWEPLENNITRDFEHIFADLWQAWPKQEANPDIAGNMWAPDVIWNPLMGKWCMYMSVNGERYRSLIALLTADHLDGDWTLVGPVVYSGFGPENVERTDVPLVLGPGADLERYRELTDTRINAIDAGVNFDERGQLWMNFGSWFGGCWMIRLDPATGLRDYGQSYANVPDVSDAYYGVKLAGGYWNSGEGTYLLHYGDWWYLFLSYGWLGRTGGYQIREFRSRSITGPYLDQAGNPAVSTGKVEANWTSSTGIRLLSTYRWSAGPQEADGVEISQGHNSAFVDNDGSIFIVYHTRFAGLGEDDYQTEIRQLLPTTDGWLTVAPFLYQGVRAGAEGERGEITGTQVAGDWEVIIHRPNTFFDDGRDEAKGQAGVSLDTAKGVNLPLIAHVKADGSFSLGTPQGPQTGSWQLERRPSQLPCLSITLGTTSYRGRLLTLPDDASVKARLSLTAIGNNQSIWATSLD